MTEQEAFDTVVRHMFRQKRKGMNEHGTCMYRTADGLKCAIGTLIEDDEYYPKLERRLVDFLAAASVTDHPRRAGARLMWQ